VRLKHGSFHIQEQKATASLLIIYSFFISYKNILDVLNNCTKVVKNILVVFVIRKFNTTFAVLFLQKTVYITIMSPVIERDRIFKGVDTLNRIDQFYLLAHLAKRLANAESKTHNLVNLKGLGKGLYAKNGIGNFISKERESWD
jgi:hypothetical protein